MAFLPHVSTLIQCTSKNIRPVLCKNIVRNVHSPTAKEVSIPITWGNIAGKWWGDDTRQPILSLHGWQDNAGTWDRLAPLMPADCSVLAVDLPGHGRSSWIPRGMIYDNWLFVKTVQEIMDHYKWENVSFLSHSMGSIVSFFYSSLYPENVNFYIAVENIVPDIDITPEEVYKEIGKRLKKIKIDENRLDSEPPSYSYKDVLMRWHLGTRKSVTLESAPCLIDRGTLQSKVDPTKYYFCRDPRMKYKIFTAPQPEFIHHGIQRLQMPVLHLKGAQSLYATDKLSISSRDLLEKTNPRYEYHCIPGTHHIHLNNAESVAPIIKQFLQKYQFSAER